MSIQDVERAGVDYSTAAERLRNAVIEAAEAGVPQARIARAAGVARNTVRAWIDQGKSRTA